MEDQITVVKIKKEFKRKIDIAIKYYTILSILNNLNFSDREIQLIAHTSIRGTISTVSSKQEFIKNNAPTTLATVNNLISLLGKKKILYKDGKMIRLNPKLMVNFNSADSFIFNISCTLQKESMTL